MHGARGPSLEGNFSTCCPFCDRRVGKVDEDYKLTFKFNGRNKDGEDLTPDRGAWNCYRCGARGYAEFTWFGQASEVPPEGVEPPRPDLGPPEGFISLDECSRSVTMRAYWDYFEGRGVLANAIWVGAGACYKGRYEGRVVVPHLGEKGEWLGFAARAVGAREPKYLYPRGMDRRNALWGARYLEEGEVYAVEGIFDSLPLLRRSVATLGKSVTPQQVDAMVALGRPIVPCLDGDAWKECRQLAYWLRLAGAEVPGWIKLPPGDDPGKLGWNVRDYWQPCA